MRRVTHGLVALAAAGTLLAGAGCTDEQGPKARSTTSRPAPEPAVYQSEVEEGVGAAVVILVDTSGSMSDAAAGDSRPKHEVARRAVEKMLAATDAFVARRPDFPIKVSLMHFSSDVWVDRPILPYDRAALQKALASLPRPGGGTGIGTALQRARPELYRSGAFRKYILVVTDGENTAGAPPDHVAREIHRKSEGAVATYFVAFDTSPTKFAFLKEVGGDVVPARSAEELEAALKEIYEGKILAEAMDYGETEPAAPRSR